MRWLIYLGLRVTGFGFIWWMERRVQTESESRTSAIRRLLQREAQAIKDEEEATGVKRLRVIHARADGSEKMTQWEQRKLLSDAKRRKQA